MACSSDDCAWAAWSCHAGFLLPKRLIALAPCRSDAHRPLGLRKMRGVPVRTENRKMGRVHIHFVHHRVSDTCGRNCNEETRKRDAHLCQRLKRELRVREQTLPDMSDRHYYSCSANVPFLLRSHHSSPITHHA